MPTYHIEADGSIDPERGVISHRQVDTGDVVEESGWLPEEGTLEIGLTAGASTPDSLIGRTVRAILETFGEDPELALAASTTVVR